MPDCRKNTATKSCPALCKTAPDTLTRRGENRSVFFNNAIPVKLRIPPDSPKRSMEGVPNNNADNKSMVIRITDEELLEKTGGIIQGMSGSPIIQNGKFIGCVTNVLVNDATQGYAVFGDIMISQMRK